jgi:hypothetical protein
VPVRTSVAKMTGYTQRYGARQNPDELYLLEIAGGSGARQLREATELALHRPRPGPAARPASARLQRLLASRHTPKGHFRQTVLDKPQVVRAVGVNVSHGLSNDEVVCFHHNILGQPTRERL